MCCYTVCHMPCAKQGGKNCLKGFSVQGRIEKSRRNYTQMWEQIGSYRKREGAAALSNFRLNILGEVVEYFAVPREWRTVHALGAVLRLVGWGTQSKALSTACLMLHRQASD